MEKYTDQEFFYKQTPVNYDGIAKFTSIKGNTLGWNQLIQNGNFADTSWWSFTAGTLTVSNNIGTFKAIAQYQSVSKGWFVNAIPQGHKLLCVATLKSYTANNTRFIVRDIENGVTSNIDQITLSTTKQTYSIIHTRSSGTSGMQLLFQDNNSSGWGNIEISNAMLFDLTQMGLDITDPSDFTSLFSLPYYDYNQGSLLSFSGNGIKTVGKNKLKIPSSATLNGITFNVDADGQIQITGTATAQTDFYLYGASGRYDDMGIISSTYTFSCRKDSTTTGLNFFLVGQQIGTRIGVQLDNTSLSQIVALDGSDKYRVFMRVTNGTTINTKIALQLEFGSSATSYEPYTSTTTDLPISNYFPTGMKRAGNVYDELLPNKAITRVKQIIFDGSSDENWSVVAGTHRAYITVSDIDTSTPDTSVGNIMSNMYVAGDYNTGAIVDKITTRYNLAQINVFDSTNITSSSTANTWKAYLQNHPLIVNYELATETETDAEDIFYKFYGNGTEQLLPVNGSTPTTSYLIADIEYYDSTEGDSLYRRFWLINGDGERWDLTDKEFRSFLNNPTGLGFRKTIEVTRYGEKANKNNEVYDFPQPSGELLFYDTYNSTRYDKYNKFIRFLMSQPITLYYMIPVSYISGIANIFTLDCDVTEVQKTESKTDRILTSSIVFNGLGFYEGDEISINGTTDTYTLTNEGDFPVGFEITVEGSLTKPYITLSQDGELYGEAKFVGTQAYNSLYLNSNDGEQNIILQQGGSVIPNPLSYQDLSISNGSIYVTFVKLAKGVSELSIVVESGSITNVNIKYSPKYRSV